MYSSLALRVVYNILFVPESIHLLASTVSNTHKHTQESSMGPADMLGDDGVVLYATDDIILLLVRKARGNEL